MKTVKPKYTNNKLKFGINSADTKKLLTAAKMNQSLYFVSNV